jgi:type 2 lantibiotic biosynthesis protein LanM
VRPLNAARERPREWPIIVDERRAIDALDVPRLLVGADSRAVASAGGAILDDCYQRSPLDAARDRLSCLSADDRDAQRRALGRALGESIATRFTSAAPARGDDPAAHAEWIGRELLAHAQAAGGSLIWTDAPLENAATHHLYDGTLGPALFLSALAATTGDAAWRCAAQQALAPALQWTETADGRDGEPLAIGGCSGLGSIVYALACAGALLDDQRAVDAASRVATWIDADRIDGDRRFDVVDGAAGALLGVLALHARTRDERLLETAQLCGDHLLAFHDDVPAGWAWPADDGRQLVGFAHGAAGIATALIRLDAATGCSIYRGAATEALGFVSGAFAPGVASWPIAAGDSDDVAAVAGRMNAWCHGAPGICLAAASALDIAAEVDFLAQARSAAGRLARWDANQADHLCCGHFGRVEVLLTAGVRLVGDGAADAARQIAARVVERARRLRHFRLSTPGFEYRVFDAGLFRGLSGIGYELLRLAAPDRLPSVLWFEPAMSSR